MRAVFDPNVLISAVLSRSGTPAQLIAAWMAGRYELIVSPALLDELRRALGYPKISKRIPLDDAKAYLQLLRSRATPISDPVSGPPIHCADPDDDYLIAAAHASSSALVTGDAALLELAGRIPVFAPREFWTMIHS